MAVIDALVEGRQSSSGARAAGASRSTRRCRIHPASTPWAHRALVAGAPEPAYPSAIAALLDGPLAPEGRVVHGAMLSARVYGEAKIFGAIRPRSAPRGPRGALGMSLR
ncbi:hypothetical protein GXW73_26690 [Roseomonas hellenica]|nr:hypothetical protein [Plastoroseomonas hellenica]MBR0646450.1 hypothetical protein [Plastoroseomonas hellenica]